MDKTILKSFGMGDIEISGEPEAIKRLGYYLVVGCFVQGWAALEYTFDLCVAIIYEHSPEGQALAQKLPTALSEKIKFFKLAHDRIDKLKPNSDRAKRIASAIDAIGKFRHLVFHSVEGFTDNDDIRDLRRMVVREGERKEARIKLNSHDFAKMLRLMTQMFGPVTDYGKTLLSLFPTKQLPGRNFSAKP